MERPSVTRRANAPALVVVGGLLLLALAVAVVGMRGERHLQGTNHVRAALPVVPLAAGQTACQRREIVPAGTGGVRLWVSGDGSPFSVAAGAARGARAAGWAAGPVDVDLPVVKAAQPDAQVCVTNAGPGTLTLAGDVAARAAAWLVVGSRLPAATVDAVPQPGRARVDYLRPHAESWWALAPVLADRVAGARDALPGDVSAYVAALLAVAVAAGLVLVRRRLRLRAGATVAVLTTLNVLSWGMIVPPFQVPDEQSHLYYAQYLGETGKLPAVRPGSAEYADDVQEALALTRFASVAGDETARPSWDVHVTGDPDRTGAGNAATASTNPPLYYLAQAAVYRAGHGLDVLDRLALMRVLSALLAGLTAWCVFAFLRELLPGAPVAWTVGGLLTGLMPMFAFISSGVNNDAGLYLASAALFLLLARTLRRGLTPRRAAACGAVLGAGVLVKTQMLAFTPAVALAFVLAKAPWRAWASAAVALASPLALYALLGQTVWRRPVLDRVDILATSSPRSGTLPDRLSYLWQEYLPRIPPMTDLVPGVQPWSLWFKGLVGRFGWLDYGYAGWVYATALVLVAATVAVAAVGVWRERRARARELAVFAVAAGGLMVAVATVSYQAPPPFDQGRYLLPLLPLFALVPALAVAVVGERRGRVLGAALVVAALGFSVLAQLLSVARFYG